jgi:hypothetical protein
MKPRKPKVPSINIPGDLHFEIREYSITTGLRMTKIAEIALRQYLKRKHGLYRIAPIDPTNK